MSTGTLLRKYHPQLLLLLTGISPASVTLKRVSVSNKSQYSKLTFKLKLHTTFRTTFSNPEGTQSKSNKQRLISAYRTLEVSVAATNEEILASYTNLVKKYHPDSQGDHASTEKFQAVRNAFQVIQKERDTIEAEDPVHSTEATDLDQDIDHTAPQHRQFLSHDGKGYGTPSQRMKQFEQRRAQEALERTFRYKFEQKMHIGENSLIPRSKKPPTRRRSTNPIELIAEEQLRAAAERGEFENLEGEGKPLKQQNAPYVDTITLKLNEILMRSGAAPDWVVLSKEIRDDLKEAKERLEKERQALPEKIVDEKDIRRWQNAKQQYIMAVKEINNNVDRCNNLVPSIRQERGHVNPHSLIKKLDSNQPVSNENS